MEDAGAGVGEGVGVSVSARCTWPRCPDSGLQGCRLQAAGVQASKRVSNRGGIGRATTVVATNVCNGGSTEVGV